MHLKSLFYHIIQHFESKPKKIYHNRGVAYANGPIHLGHLAGVYIPADIYARYLRLQNRDVVFVCGSDEHGVPITLKAKKEGVDPQVVVDRYHDVIQQSFLDFGISFDHYSRTSGTMHHQTASDFFKQLEDNGQFVGNFLLSNCMTLKPINFWPTVFHRNLLNVATRKLRGSM